MTISKLTIKIKGKRFGRLIAIRETSVVKRKYFAWLFLCDCGKKKKLFPHDVIQGITKSCGCLARDLSRKRNKTHGMSNTPTWVSWRGMRKRCLEKGYHAYPRYGGRGIKICDRWNSFENFLADMGERPPGTTLDRIDVNGNYEPGNCRWADWVTQAKNRRKRNVYSERVNKNSVLFTLNNESKTVAHWSRKTGIAYHRIWARIKHGWPHDMVLSPENHLNNSPMKKAD